MQLYKALFNFLFILCACIFSLNIALADVISNKVKDAIKEPSGTYNLSPPSILNMTVKTVINSGSCTESDYNGCTFQDVLGDTDSKDDFKPEIKVRFSADDFLHNDSDNGSEYNATLRQRGDTSRESPQKSFRIKLKSKDKLWRGERRIQLIKSFGDLSRVRNKLSYDLFSTVPHLPSMRTQFVQLMLEDQGNIQDLGLFTQVEYFGKEYLKRRGWEKGSRIYKTEFFIFQNSTSLALDSEGQPINKNAFEEIIEIKNGNTHFNLINMIGAVNNYSTDFKEDIFQQYFNQDNYLSWFAVNILVNHADSDAHNYYLYNPKDSKKFYFVPWDYDFAWGTHLEGTGLKPSDMPRWWYSHAYWWGNMLHERFLSTDGNISVLKNAVTEIKNKYFSPEAIDERRRAYYDVVFPIITNSPDWNEIYIEGTDPERIAAYNKVFSGLTANIESNYQRFLSRVNDPMPFYLLEPVTEGSNIIFFDWDDSKSISGQTIVYDLLIASSKDFDKSTIDVVKNIELSEHYLYWTHKKGSYYFKVIARDVNNKKANWQVAYDESVINYKNYVPLYGIKNFFVDSDGDLTKEHDPEPYDSNTNGDNENNSEKTQGTKSGGANTLWLLLFLGILLIMRREIKLEFISKA